MSVSNDRPGHAAAPGPAAGLDAALELIEALANGIGPRRPTSPAERAAAQLIAGRLGDAGIAARLEDFDGYDSFARPYGAIAALAVAPALLPRAAAGARWGLGAAAAALLAAEGGLVHTPLSDALARSPSVNVAATVEPRGRATRTLCLLAHLDSSRSGLLFDPRFAAAVRALLSAQALASGALVAEPLLRRSRPGRAAVALARAVNLAGLALLAERELRGVDVPGANDNASGAAAVVTLAAELAAQPLSSTRVEILIAGCEESGLLGARAFLNRHATDGWIFLNFDGVAAPATLRYLPEEGLVRTWKADPALVGLAERIRAERPELALEPVDQPLGLTYDATAVLARGGRALTLVAGDHGRIPNYHQPSDTVANLDPPTLGRALEVGRELIRLVDAGEADLGRV